MPLKRPKLFIYRLLYCTILSGISLNSISQDTMIVGMTKNSIHVECATLFYIGMYSVNYERTIFQTTILKVNANAGIGGWYWTTISQSYKGNYSFPFSLNFLLGSGNNYFETDLGARYTAVRKGSAINKPPFFPIINLGYRYQRPDGKRLIFRSFIGMTGIGIGIGKAF